MTEQQPALFMQARTDTDAEDMRRWMSAIHNDRPGFFGVNDFLVSERAGGVNLSVDVAGGRAMVEGTSAVYQGLYFVENRGVTNVPLGAADATNGRIDLLVIRVRDELYASGLAGSPWDIFAVQGTPAPAPAVPALPANCSELARVTVLSLAARNPANITNAEVVDRRMIGAQGLAGMYGAVLAVKDSTERVAIIDPFEYMQVRERNTNRIWIWNGSAWTWPKAAQGELAYVEHATQVTGIGTGGFDFCSAAGIVIPAGRILELTGRCNLSGTGTAVVLTGKIDTTIQAPRLAQMNSLPNSGAAFHGSLRLALAAGTKTFVLGIITGAGTINLESSNDKAFLLLKDIGGV